MMSLKNLSRASLVVVLIFMGFIVVANFMFLPQMRLFGAKSTELIEQSRKELSEMEIAIRVLNNVHGVVKRDGEEALSANQVAAYESNQQQVEKTTLAFGELLSQLKSNYKDINGWSLGRHDETVNRLNEVIEGILSDLHHHDTSYSHLDATNAAHASMGEAFIDLVRYNQTLNDVVLKDITYVINSLILLLIAVIALFGVGINGFVTKDLPYIMKSLSQIESNQYDVSQLPQLQPKFTEQYTIKNYIQQIMTERQFTMEVRDLLSKQYIVDDVVTALFEVVHESLGIDRIGVAFVDYNREKIVAEFGTASFEPILLGPGFEVRFDQTSLSKMLKQTTTNINNDLRSELNARPNSASLSLIVREGIQSNMIVPLKLGGAVFGMVFLSSIHKDHFTDYHQKLAEKIIYEISGLLNKSYFTKVVLSKFTTSFSQIVENKDNDTGEHIERMVQYAVAIANSTRDANHPDYNISKKDILDIERNASAHDIGKVGIPDEILKKPGKLTPEEWLVMKTHVDIGADIFASLREDLRMFDEELFKTAEEIARYHHEKWDGTGYPYGLKGHEIPLSARIVALSDVFDALSSKRVYKNAFDFQTSVETIIEGRGKHFDPFIVDCFLANIHAIEKIYNKK